MEAKPDFLIVVHTGDRKHSGTNNKVYVRLHSEEGNASKPIVLNKFFSDDLENDRIDSYRVDPDLVENMDASAKIERVEVWKHSFLGVFSDEWFVSKIVVENTGTNLSFVFPFFRWIKSGRHYNIKQFDTSLPQFDEFLGQRKRELEEKKKAYQYYQRIPNGPVQIKKIPPDEQFAFDYKWDIAKTKVTMAAAAKLETIFSQDWETIEDIKKTYNNEHFDRPKSVDIWDSDLNFGRLRIASVNSNMITVLKEIPEKFPVTDDMLGSLLGGLTLKEAMEQKRLFLTDLWMMDNIPIKKGFVVCSPIGLFFLDDNQRLLPVAIQLFQVPSPTNPIFTPQDPELTWTLVKMWYNNADAGYHQSLTHLGFTHLRMEGVTISTNRNLSPSHPIFKLLAPHFLYLIAINAKGLSTLADEGGWVDMSMNIGAKGLIGLIKKAFDQWEMDTDGLLTEDLKKRGFDDPDLLPGYYYRDDAMVLYTCILEYVTSYVGIYYTSDAILKEDVEIQAWVHELVKERDGHKGGCGIKGVPGNGELTSCQDLVKILTCTIFTCSVMHAAANFPQYDEYGFPPNYPATMKGKPPSSKDAEVTEHDLMASLPDQELTLDIMTMTTVLSSKGTNNLGDFEVQYVFDPAALEVIAKFREDLKTISEKIKDRNTKVYTPYDYLDPEHIPNAISI